MEDSGSKIELDEVHDSQMDINQLIDPESITHGDEVIGEPMETQAPRHSTKVSTVPEKFGISCGSGQGCDCCREQ